jgi:hypothetical protein
LIRTFAEGKHKQNLLLAELTRLLEPAPEFTRLAIANIETRNLTATVLDSWKTGAGERGWRVGKAEDTQLNS